MEIDWSTSVSVSSQLYASGSDLELPDAFATITADLVRKFASLPSSVNWDAEVWQVDREKARRHCRGVSLADSGDLLPWVQDPAKSGWHFGVLVEPLEDGTSKSLPWVWRYTTGILYSRVYWKYYEAEVSEVAEDELDCWETVRTVIECARQNQRLLWRGQGSNISQVLEAESSWTGTRLYIKSVHVTYLGHPYPSRTWSRAKSRTKLTLSIQ